MKERICCELAVECEPSILYQVACTTDTRNLNICPLLGPVQLSALATVAEVPIVCLAYIPLPCLKTPFSETLD